MKRIFIFHYTIIFLAVLYAPVVFAGDVTLPAQSVVYLSTNENLIGKKNQVSAGQFVRCSVWRDVVRDGQILIKAGTPALAKVDSFKSRKVAGIKGKMTLAAMETETVDGNTITLMGGYNKEGKGRAAMSWSLSALVAWPLVFIPGDAAKLPAGTVFDAYTTHSATVNILNSAKRVRVVDLSSIADEFSIELLYDELTSQKKPKTFPFQVTTTGGMPSEIVIDRVNGSDISPIPLTVQSVENTDNGSRIMATAPIKKLAKKFAKGINTLEASYTEDGTRIGAELVIEIQF